MIICKSTCTHFKVKNYRHKLETKLTLSWPMKFNQNLAWPYMIIFIMRHWSSQATVEWEYRSNHSQLWGEKLGTSSKQVVTIIDHEIQSQPCITFWYPHNEALEQSSCCEMRVWILTLVAFGMKRWTHQAKIIPSYEYKVSWWRARSMRGSGNVRTRT